MASSSSGSLSIQKLNAIATSSPPVGQQNWYLHMQGKMALPKILEATKRLVGEHKILRSQGSGNLELTFGPFATQPQARLVLPWDFPSSPAVLFIHGSTQPRPIVLSSFNSDHEISSFAQAVALARAQHAYTAATTGAPVAVAATPVVAAVAIASPAPVAVTPPPAPRPVAVTNYVPPSRAAPSPEAKRESISASELYLNVLRLVCVDGKISPDGDERLSTLRRNYAISDQEHKEVLARLAMTTEDFERLRKAGRAEPSNARECVICMDQASDHMIEECGHVCLCATCAPRLPIGDKCPKCRAIVTRIKRVYL